MAAKCSFDIVSRIDLQEVDNAVNMAVRELQNRYDFKGSEWKIEFQRKEEKIQLSAETDFKLEQVAEVVRNKIIQRDLSVKALDFQDMEPGPGMSQKQTINLRTGLDKDKCKEIVKFIKDLKLKKIQAQIMDETVRVTGPKRDDLQEVIQALKEKDTLGVPMQFTNYK